MKENDFSNRSSVCIIIVFTTAALVFFTLFLNYSVLPNERVMFYELEHTKYILNGIINEIKSRLDYIELFRNITCSK